jgi:hypothetical protein
MYARAMFHFLGSDGSLLIGIQPFSWLSQENFRTTPVFVSHSAMNYLHDGCIFFESE